MSASKSTSPASNKFYSEKSKAKRALNSIGVAALQAAEQLLFQGEDGRWGFDMNAAERIQDNADNGDDELAPATLVVTDESYCIETKDDGQLVDSDNGSELVPAVVAPAAPVLGGFAGPRKFDPLHPHCPECGKDIDQTWATEDVSVFCHHCSTTYSITTGKKINAGFTRPNAPSGYKIQKDRPTQNGVKRPSEGTVCGAVWAEFDKNPGTTSKDLTALAEAHKWNRNNVVCEFYAWRKFNGITGRQS